MGSRRCARDARRAALRLLDGAQRIDSWVNSEADHVVRPGGSRGRHRRSVVPRRSADLLEELEPRGASGRRSALVMGDEHDPERTPGFSIARRGVVGSQSDPDEHLRFVRHPIGEVVLDLLDVAHDLTQPVRVAAASAAVAAQVVEPPHPFSARSEALASPVSPASITATGPWGRSGRQPEDGQQDHPFIVAERGRRCLTVRVGLTQFEVGQEEVVVEAHRTEIREEPEHTMPRTRCSWIVRRHSPRVTGLPRL